MGLEIVRVPPNEFLLWSFDYNDRKRVLDLLREVSLEPLDDAVWRAEPSGPMRDFPHGYPSQRVGSYTAYGVFTLLLEELVFGVNDTLLGPDEEIEQQALQAFRDAYTKRVGIPEARHILEMPDSGDAGAYIPVLFEEPHEVSDVTLASLPGALAVLRATADTLDFDLEAKYEPEESDGMWLPLGTMRNIARVLFRFLAEDDSKVVLME